MYNLLNTANTLDTEPQLRNDYYLNIKFKNFI